MDTAVSSLGWHWFGKLVKDQNKFQVYISMSVYIYTCFYIYNINTYQYQHITISTHNINNINVKLKVASTTKMLLNIWLNIAISMHVCLHTFIWDRCKTGIIYLDPCALSLSQDADPGVRWIAVHPLGNGWHDHAEYGRPSNGGLAFYPQHPMWPHGMAVSYVCYASDMDWPTFQSLRSSTVLSFSLE